MTQFARCRDVLWRMGGDRVVVRRLCADGLDLIGAAAMLWAALDQPRSLQDLCAELDEFAVTPDVVATTLNDLISQGLVERLTSSARGEVRRR